MNIRSLPKTDKPLTPRYVSALKIQTYDVDNLYPQNVLAKISASKNACGCLERYVDYLEGNGIANTVLGNHVVNTQGETLNAVHSLVASDFATFGGFALHVNYDAFGRIVELQHVPFEDVRLEEPDEDGHILHVALHPDWSGRATRNGKPIKVNSDNTDYINIFNPDPEVVVSQITAAGGPEYYHGQILYYSSAGYMVYPVPSFAAVLTDMSTDEGLSNLSLRNARMNFIPAGVYYHFRDRSAPDEDGGNSSEGYSEELAKVQGDMNAFKIIDLEIDSPDDKPDFVPFQGKNTDKDFTETSAEVKEAIYSAFGQEGWLSIRNGKVGFSGTLLADISEEYAAKMKKRQKKMQEAYFSILSRWSDFEPLPLTPALDLLAIEPMIYQPSKGLSV